ncbi:MAG TPA: hypothetical protein O0X91_01410, partial [Methanocorpusculum sp.]|nr:hypothetical protein [Methanocorpusculum sp.]
KKVLTRAEEVLKSALREDAVSGGQKYYTQMLLFDSAPAEAEPSAVEERLKEVNPNDITPMQALMLVNELKALMEKK